MKYRSYPGTDFSVSTIGFGLWTTSTGWWGAVNDEQAISLIQEAYHSYGVTFFDAADSYGNGRSETQLGSAFKSCRDKIIYATKFGYDFYNHGDERRGQQEIPHDFSPKFVRFALEQSLKRLQTDYIDLYQIHNVRHEQVVSDELFGLLEEFKAEGKIRHYGVTLGPAIGWLYEGIDAIEQRKIESMHMIYNLFEPFPGNEILAAAERSNTDTGFVIRVPHSSGMLEGNLTVDTVFPANDHRKHRPRSWLLNGVKKVETLRFLELPNRNLGQAALQWILTNPRVMTVLPNIYDAAGLKAFATTCEAPDLTPTELARIAELAQTNFGVSEDEQRFKGTMIRPDSQAQPVAAGV